MGVEVSHPYRDAARAYVEAGWRGVLPLPAGRKFPPPSGWTGRGAPYPSGADVQEWIDGTAGDGNICLRMPDGVIGLDVDNYRDKAGGAWLAELEEKLGPLPATWMSTARDDGISGIRFYRVPASMNWPGQAAPGIEIIQAAHRYAVVWPSAHPEGGTYGWVSPERGAPHVQQLPALPDGWVQYLQQLVVREPIEGANLTDEATRAWLGACRAGDACRVLRDVLDRAVAELRSGTAAGSRHDIMTRCSRTLAAYGGEGHRGAGRVLVELREAFLASVENDVGRDGPSEWLSALSGAIRLAAAEHPEPDGWCDCDLWDGGGVQFDAPWGTALPQYGGAVEEGGSGGDEGPGLEAGDGSEGTPVGEEPTLVDQMEKRLLTAAQMAAVAPPTPLVDGLLAVDSESWLIAKSGAGKTFVALDIAGHVGRGMDWQGRAVLRGGVLYLVAEGSGGMGSRVRAWQQRHGEMNGVAFLPMPVQVKDAIGWATLVELCRRMRPVLVVLDTQARITVGLNENDNSEMGLLIDAIGRLRGACGACVLVVHHLGRSGLDARGASAIDGAQDSELKLVRMDSVDGRFIMLKTDKQRNMPDDVEIQLELVDRELDDGTTSLTVETPLIDARVLEPDWQAHTPLNQRVLLDVMYDIFTELGATKSELKSEVRKRRRVEADGKSREPMTESSYRKAWDALVADGRLVRVAETQRYRAALRREEAVNGDVDKIV